MEAGRNMITVPACIYPMAMVVCQTCVVDKHMKVVDCDDWTQVNEARTSNCEFALNFRPHQETGVAAPILPCTISVAKK